VWSVTALAEWPGRRLQWVAAGVVLATTALAVATYPRLPATVAVHFSATGTPGNEVPRWAAVALVPGSLLATWAVLLIAARIDPPDDSRTMDAITCSTLGLVGVVQLVVLARALDYRIPMGVVLVAVVVWSTFVVAYTIHREGLD
jgi:uncharacterized membrane protein